MQVYPVLLLSFIYRLPETPRWLISKDREDGAREALADINGEDEADKKLDDLKSAVEDESSKPIHYKDMLSPWGAQFHPTILTIMGQVSRDETS